MTGGRSLVELFHAEVESHGRALRDGLDLLERGDGSALPGLLRAAHSLLGAARIIGLTSAETLAHALVTLFAAIERGRPTLSAAERTALRRATAAIARLTSLDEVGLVEWDGRGGDGVAELVKVLDPSRVAPGAADERQAMDPAMLELFKMETEAHAATLARGLVALERDAGNTEQIEELMRAAHSIKGAARVVGLDPAVRLAHVVEDYFVAARAGQVAVAPEAIDVLLRATDRLGQLAQVGTGDLAGWLAVNSDALQATSDEVALLAQGGLADVSSDPVVAPEVVPDEADEAAAPPDAPATAPPGAPPRSAATSRPPSRDRVVKVSAANIDRLMGLAGESLMAARRLQPFAGALHRLRYKQSSIADMLEEVRSTLGDLPPQTAALLDEAKARAIECSDVLAERMQEIEGWVRRSEDTTGRLYREAIASRMRPFGDAVQGFARLVRDLARSLGKRVDLELTGEDVGVDRDILERIESPLNHMLRNAVDHGIETSRARVAAGKSEVGSILVDARHRAGMLLVMVCDDGKGIDPARVRRRVVERGLASTDQADAMTTAQLFEHVFSAGFSTADQITEVSGRGVGLDVVRSMVHDVGGSVRVTSELGVGTAFHLQLPITRSVMRAMVVDVAGEPYAFPLQRIDRVLTVSLSELKLLEERQFIVVEGQNVGLVQAVQILELDGGARAKSSSAVTSVVILGDRTHRFGVVVDRFRGEHDLVVRPLDRRLGKVADIAAAAILDDGAPVLIVDVEDMIRSILRLLQVGQLQRVAQAASDADARPRKRVLIVDDSITVREVERQLLAARGYDVTVAVDGMDGWHTLRNAPFDLVVTDVDMPRMNGIELVRSIKQDRRLAAIPVMIVSYRDREEDRLRGLDAGADYYLTKSNFHDDALLRAVVNLIGEPGAAK